MKRATLDVDNLDLQIISLLQENSKVYHKDIARKLKITTGTVLNRIKRLEKIGVLTSFSITVDPAKLGYGLTVLILIESDEKCLLNVEEEIAGMSNVISIYNITGDYNIVLTARFSDKLALDEFVRSLTAMPFIKRTATNIASSVIKEGFRINLN